VLDPTGKQGLQQVSGGEIEVGTVAEFSYIGLRSKGRLRHWNIKLVRRVA